VELHIVDIEEFSDLKPQAMWNLLAWVKSSGGPAVR
jgi:hypothetical protein